MINLPVLAVTATEALAIRANAVFAAIYNDGANTVYWGGKGLTSATGIPLPPGQGMVFDEPHGDVYVRCGAGLTATLRRQAVQP